MSNIYQLFNQIVHVVNYAVNNNKPYCVVLRTLGYFLFGICRYLLNNRREISRSPQSNVFQSFPVSVNDALWK